MSARVIDLLKLQNEKKKPQTFIMVFFTFLVYLMVNSIRSSLVGSLHLPLGFFALSQSQRLVCNHWIRGLHQIPRHQKRLISDATRPRIRRPGPRSSLR